MIERWDSVYSCCGHCGVTSYQEWEINSSTVGKSHIADYSPRKFLRQYQKAMYLPSLDPAQPFSSPISTVEHQVVSSSVSVVEHHSWIAVIWSCFSLGVLWCEIQYLITQNCQSQHYERLTRTGVESTEGKVGLTHPPGLRHPTCQGGGWLHWLYWLLLAVFIYI